MVRQVARSNPQSKLKCRRALPSFYSSSARSRSCRAALPRRDGPSGCWRRRTTRRRGLFPAREQDEGMRSRRARRSPRSRRLEACVAGGVLEDRHRREDVRAALLPDVLHPRRGRGHDKRDARAREENACLDPSVPEVKQQFQYLYQYGFSLFAQGLLTEESLPRVVQSELCDRLGMDGEAFEAWLGVTVRRVRPVRARPRGALGARSAPHRPSSLHLAAARVAKRATPYGSAYFAGGKVGGGSRAYMPPPLLHTKASVMNSYAQPMLGRRLSVACPHNAGTKSASPPCCTRRRAVVVVGRGRGVAAAVRGGRGGRGARGRVRAEHVERGRDGVARARRAARAASASRRARGG